MPEVGPTSDVIFELKDDLQDIYIYIYIIFIYIYMFDIFYGVTKEI